MVETGAGIGSGFDDEEYRQAGAMLVSAVDAWGADMVIKVKEPLEAEYQHLRDQIVFTYFHLSGVAKAFTEALLDRGTTAIAYRGGCPRPLTAAGAHEWRGREHSLDCGQLLPRVPQRG
jgi:alanine dehydrogenase